MPATVVVAFASVMTLALAGVAAALVAGGEPRDRVGLVALVPMLAVLAYVIAAFRRLRVEVRPGELRVAFGALGPRRRIDLATVRAARPIRTRPRHGWGIRFVPGGWMWNVWGLDAVELELASGRRFVVGAARPAELAAAIESARPR